MTNPRFTVVDVETTGLFPGGSDRIIEIALISLDSEGNILREYETLLNPERDLGPVHITRISRRRVIISQSLSHVYRSRVQPLLKVNWNTSIYWKPS